MKLNVICICILLILLVPTVSALNITATVGETWIVYKWAPGSTVNVYIDGVKEVTNTTFSDYYLVNSNADEKHQIKLYNSSNTGEQLGSLTAITLHSQGIIYGLIALLIFFFVLMLFKSDPVKTLLIGSLSASISLYTWQISLGYNVLMLIPIITLVIDGIFIAYALWEIIIEKTRW